MPLHAGMITNRTNRNTNRRRCTMLDYVKMDLNLKFEFESTAHLEEQCSSDIRISLVSSGFNNNCMMFLSTFLTNFF